MNFAVPLGVEASCGPHVVFLHALHNIHTVQYQFYATHTWRFDRRYVVEWREAGSLETSTAHDSIGKWAGHLHSPGIIGYFILYPNNVTMSSCDGFTHVSTVLALTAGHVGQQNLGPAVSFPTPQSHPPSARSHPRGHWSDAYHCRGRERRYAHQSPRRPPAAGRYSARPRRQRDSVRKGSRPRRGARSERRRPSFVGTQARRR